MIIKEGQLNQISSQKSELFISASLVFLKKNFSSWCQGKSNEDLTVFIYSMMKFCKNHHVQRGMNIQKIMYGQIFAGFVIPLQEPLALIMNETQKDEDQRVEQFLLCIFSGRAFLQQIFVD